MLEYIIEQTSSFLATMPKKERKKIGQFFTSKETAIFMASLFDFSSIDDSITVLDPGSGTGILSAAFLERAETVSELKKIHITCYETDPVVLPILYSNLQYMKEHSVLEVEYNVIEKDYILSQSSDFTHDLLESQKPVKYDYIIGNPPYLRILRDHPAALAMPEVVYGAPNMYFLFAAMSLFNLKQDSEMVYIIPRSWTSGAYFKAFRTYLLKNGKIERVHLFVSRDKVFDQEQVLQETIIIVIRKTTIQPDSVCLSSCQTSNDFSTTESVMLPYESVVVGDDLYVFLPTSEEEINTIKRINRYTTTMPDIGFRMKTGIIVDFRQWDELRSETGEHIIPLFYAQHIKNGRVNHDPSGRDFDWVIDTKPGLIQRNKNYVFCKRFTAKEEYRRLQCGIYLSADFPDYQNIGTQNKINFVERVNGNDMSLEETYGIYALLNSTLFDSYYRILNGSTQVNSTEVNSIPVPSLKEIAEIGKKLLQIGSLTTETCDTILDEVAYG